MSGFTHNITNQIHGASIEPAQAQTFLEQGWVDDEVWLLQTLHEFAHALLNFSAVGRALVLTELSMDQQLYEGMSANADPKLARDSRGSLSLAYDLLSPWSEAVALINEWDLDLTIDHPTEPLDWMAQLVGRDTFDEYLWRARLSPLGIEKKKITLVSSCYERGHLLGQLLSRALRIPGDLRSDGVLAAIKRCVFSNVDLAHAILDLADNTRSIPAIYNAREHLTKTLAGAAEHLYEELLHGPDIEYSSRLEAGVDELIQRMQPLVHEFEKPVVPARGLPRDIEDICEMGRAIAYWSFSMRALVGLGTAPIDIVAHGAEVSCVSEGKEIYSFDNKVGFEGFGHGTIELGFCILCGPDTKGIRVSSHTRGLLHTFGDDDHIVKPLFSARIPAEITEGAQGAAALLSAASNVGPVCPPGPTPGRHLAAKLVEMLVEQATGASINLQMLSPYGVGGALGRDRDLIMALARLSNEFSSAWTPGGRAALPGGPVASNDQLTKLNTRLQSVTRLGLGARTELATVLLW